MYKRVWRIGAFAVLIVIGLTAPVRSQTYSLAPYPRLQFFTNTAAVCNGCLLNAYLTGTSTRRDTYSDNSGTAHANPIVLSSSGRATVYLAVGVSYRLVLTDASAATTYFDVDPVQAVPASAGNLDITATAGEALAAGDATYLSDGTGSLTAGRWYQADADNAYESSTAGIVGFATAAIASAGTGTVRIAGRISGLSGLISGEFYYVSATAGALTGTPPANQRFLGEADSTTTLDLNGGGGAVLLPDSDGTHRLALITTSNLTDDRRIALLPGDSNRQITLSGDLNVSSHATINQDVSTTGTPSFNAFRPPQGRCTLTSATPVPTADVTAATTLYYALYSGNQITLYDGSTRWVQRAFTELSIAVPSTTNTMYDVFVDYTAGVPVLEAVTWTNDSTRATDLALQNGVYVQTSDTDSLYVCSVRTTGVSGQTEDSFARRLLWNYYNRVDLPMRVLEATDTWAYTTATMRQANGNAANQLDFVIGVAEVTLEATAMSIVSNSTASTTVVTAIGLDSTSAAAAGSSIGYRGVGPANNNVLVTAFLRTRPAIGRHIATWLEYSEAIGTTTWRGDNGTPLITQSGIMGSIKG